MEKQASRVVTDSMIGLKMPDFARHSERVATVLEGWRETTTRGLVEALIDDVARFAHGAEQSDDITCLAVQLQPQHK